MSNPKFISELQQLINESERIVFFGGAGVSTASGIPDFRSSKGLFMKESGYRISAEEIVSNHFFNRHPKIFFEFYFENLVYEKAQPNLVHKYIANLEKREKNIIIVTQNIDGLHKKAGSTQIFNLHGDIYSNYCTKCHRHYTLDELQLDSDGIPRCEDDQAIVKPDVILYGEKLHADVVEGAVQAIAQADLLIIAGTSLAVYPAAGLINHFNGKKVVVINNTLIRTYHLNTLFIEDDMTNVFKKLQ